MFYPIGSPPPGDDEGKKHELLPELVDMIPLLHGEIEKFSGGLYFFPEKMKEVLLAHIEGDGLDLVRVGIKVYELLRYDNDIKAFKVRQFSCSLNERALMLLSEQAVASDEE